MFRKAICCLLLSIILWASLSGIADARKWTSRDGMFSVEAELADFQKGKVLLRRADDKIISVPLDRLSLADALYVQQALQALGRDLHAEQKKADPASEVAPPITTKPPTSGESSPATSSPSRPADSQGPRVSGPPLTKPGRSSWQAQRDPGTTVAALPADAEIAFPLRSGYTKPLVVYPDAPSPYLILGSAEPKHRLKLYDLAQASSIAEFELNWANVNKIALSPNGQYVAYHSFETRGNIQVWSTKEGKQVGQIRLPQEFASPQYLAFAGNEHLVGTASGDKTHSVWAVPSGELTASLPGEAHANEGQVAVSPGGHYVAISGSKRIEIFDRRNGELAGELEFLEQNKYASVEQIRFSHDGAELAILLGSGRTPTLISFDMQTGKEVVRHELQEIPFTSGTYLGPKLEWFADNSGWLVQGKSVVERKAGGPVWTNTQRQGSYLLPIRYIDAGRMLAGTGEDRQFKLTLLPIPKEKISAGAGVLAKGGAAEDADLPPITKVNPRQAKAAQPDSAAAWTYVPRTIPFPKTIDFQKPFKLTGTLYTNFHFARNDAGRIVLGYTDNELRKRKPLEIRHANVYEVFDLSARKVAHRFELPFGMMLRGVSPQGDKGVFALDTKYERLDIFDLTNGKHLGGMRPYSVAAGDTEHQLNLRWVCYCSDELLLTLSEGKTLSAWRLPTFEPIYRMPLGYLAGVTCDATRETLAVSTPGHVYLLDAATGKTKGVLQNPEQPLESIYAGELAFRDDGQALAGTYSSEKGVSVVQWDLATGKVKTQFPVKLPSRTLTWVGPRHLLLHNTAIRPDRITSAAQVDLQRMNQCSLVDLDKQAVVWTYQHDIGSLALTSPGDKHWCAIIKDYGQPASLLAQSLPDPDTAAWIAKGTLEPPILGAGKELALKVVVEGNFPASTDEKDSKPAQIRDDIVKQLKTTMDRFQVRIGNQAAATLHLTMRERSHSTAIELRSRFGLRPGAVLRLTVTAIEVQAILRDRDGEIVWNTEHLVGLDELQNLDVEKRPKEMTPENYLRQEQWKSAVQWVNQLDIPLPLYRNGVVQGLGESRVTPTGIQHTRTPMPNPSAKDKQT